MDAADWEAAEKEAKYSCKCAEKGWDFLPVVGDMFGAVRGPGAKFLAQAAKMLGERDEVKWPTSQMMVWQSVSTCLVRRIAEAIVEARADGATTPDDPDGGGGGGGGDGSGGEEMEGVVAQTEEGRHLAQGAGTTTAQLLLGQVGFPEVREVEE